MTEDTISRKHLLSEIDYLMKSPWFNRYKDDIGVLRHGYIERKEAVEVVRDLCIKAEPSVTPVFRWIPIKEDPFSELPKDRRVWVTKEDSYGYRYVSDVAWDLKKFDDEVMNVVAYMDYYEPTPYKEGESE